MDTKPTNPKDAIGAGKLPLHLVPASFKAFTAIALAEGALKYGSSNWRAAGVRSSIYMSALQRHLDKWWNGEDRDPATGVPHLANAAACLAILIDSYMSFKLNDDRPPRQESLGGLIDGSADRVQFLQELFADKHPHHWTINDDVTEVI